MQWTAIFAVGLLVALFLLARINFTAVDLGRHLKNGEVTLEQKWPPSTTLYAYTDPDRPFVNHHWGTGVIFYTVWKWLDFKGLILFHLILRLLAVFIIFRWAVKLSNFSLAYFCLVLTLPFLTTRVDPRPEAFSYLFLCIYFVVLYRFHLGKITFNKLLLLLCPLQLIWVNVHIFFIFGPGLVTMFLIDAVLNQKSLVKSYFGAVVVLTAVNLINPFGIAGFLAPLTIFNEYGYRLAENQSLIFMQHRFPGEWSYIHFELIFFFMLLVFFVVLASNRMRDYVLPVLVMGFFSVIAWSTIRGLPIFALFFIPMTALMLNQTLRNISRITRNVVQVGLLGCAVVLVGCGLALKGHYYSPYRNMNLPWIIKDIRLHKGWLMEAIKNFNKLPGLMPYANASADFYKSNQIEGPIFNNYDIGSYLVFHLYPQQRVFLDNRPESYSVSFFKDVYVPMQEDDEVWKREDAKYHFNVIYFYRQDITPWAQPFLVRRVKDPDWAPVFVDPFTIILLKRTSKNANIINRFELPKEMFKL